MSVEIDGKYYSFTQPACTHCWLDDNTVPDPEDATVVKIRIPVVFADSEADWPDRVRWCCKCGRATTSGIFIRVDPRTVDFPQEEGD